MDSQRRPSGRAALLFRIRVVYKMTDIQIPAFTVTCLMITAIICVVTVLVAYYTLRDRVKLSQIILGMFSYVLVMLLENLLGILSGSLALPETGGPLLLYSVGSVVLARELIRYAAMGLGLRRSFRETDAALGFALGFGGLYLLVCGAYYFNLYTAVREVTTQGLDAFLAGSGTDSAEALGVIETAVSQTGWQYIATGVNRVFYLVRELSLCLLLWYAMEREDRRIYYILVPVLHCLAVLPEGMYQAGMLEGTLVRDIAACVLSAGIAALAAVEYNAKEDQAAHFRGDRLRARRRR